jgi:hypothetical protein
VGSICRVYVYCVPDFCAVVFQCLLSSSGWKYVVSYGSIITRNCFDQVVDYGSIARDKEESYLTGIPGVIEYK